MKEKMNILKKNMEEIYEKTSKYVKAYPEVEKSFDALPLRKNYYKEESLQEAMNYYLNETTEDEKKIISLTSDANDIEYLTKISQYISSDVYDPDKFVKLLDYKKCGIVELAILKEEILGRMMETEDLLDEIKNDVKETPYVKFISDRTSLLIATVESIVTPYKEVATEQFNTLKEIGINRFNDVKSETEEKINKGIKKLSKKLEDFADRNNKK